LPADATRTSSARSRTNGSPNNPADTLCEDDSQVRTGAASHVMAVLRNLVIGVLSRAGPVNLAAALRRHARNPRRPLATLGINLG
jgi:hypothetical protein